MRELVDSTPIAGDPAALRAAIADRGYVFLRGLLDPAPIRKLARDVLGALQRDGWLAGGADPERAALLPPARDFKNANFVPGYTDVQRIEYLHALPHDPALTSVLRALVGEDVFCHPRKVARLVWPAELGTTPGLYVHQDFVVEGVADMFTTWVPFVECPPELGGLAILTGSQNEGVQARFDAVDPDDERWASTHYRVGDVLLFHCLTAHGALPNRTDRLRLSADYRWQSASTPVPADALGPHLAGALPGWDELGADWADRSWVTPPEGVRVVERSGGEAAGVPASRFVRVPEQSPAEGEHVVLAGLFNNMRDAFRPRKAGGREAVVDYRIAGDGTDHHWQLVVSGGECAVAARPDSVGQVTISASFADYLKIVSGKMDPMGALGSGRLRIEGAAELAVEQLNWFRD
ncbi:phytanoyl-CoA dioxygenase family protein [Actinokineospora sp. PR83]|uniref:phytanoyl-CoA dioxygenase family protein n=1 Tax=Actinokineospora sp. PR83 TaxID=2884908 RepID=UPI001F2DD7A5|nr:phytanoyl-CoA dioxygenase family protein [Actinokineospora sp. PR83]MCG8920705.1 phytanoyl-CoA dioxygenase family protein [Actinokineospora sp. PR83]